MPKLYLGEAFTLVMKTLPILWVRIGSYLVLGLGLGLYFGVAGGLALLLGKLWAPLGFILFLVVIGGSFALVNLATRYWFHLLRAAHTAVMTEFIVNGKGPDGNQLQYGKDQVMARFRDTSILFGVDLLVGGIVKFIVRTFTRVASILPIPGMDGVGRLIERIAIMSTTYVDEAVLSRAYQEREENVWSVARDGVVLYAQAWKPILANAVVLALLSYVEFFVFLLVLGLPALAIGTALPALKVTLGITVVLGAWMLKLAVSDSFSLAATLIAYHRSTAGMTPDPEWTEKLDSMSDKFRELGQKAAQAVKPAPARTSPGTLPGLQQAAPEESGL